MAGSALKGRIVRPFGDCISLISQEEVILNAISSHSKLRLFGHVAVILAGANWLMQAQEVPVPSPHQHSPVSIIRNHNDGTYDSTNWSGYAVTGATGSVTQVTGSWKVPSATCSQGSGAQYSSFWIGIDGWTSPTVEQIGTDSDCSSGTPAYYAWFEFYPQPSYYAGRLTNLHVGDVMTALVSYDPANATFTTIILDVTQETAFSTTYTPAAGSAPLRTSAEWIAEAPSSSSGILPLADFGTVYLGYDYTSNKGACSATINGKSGYIGSFLASGTTVQSSVNVQQTSMVSESNGSPMATPGNLTADGSSFLVTWYSVGP
jgi:hypothetical protein